MIQQIPNWLAIPLQCPDRLETCQLYGRRMTYKHVSHSLVISRGTQLSVSIWVTFENADNIMKDGFLLGAHHGMTLDDVDRVCNLLKTFANRKLNVTCSVMQW